MTTSFYPTGYVQLLITGKEKTTLNNKIWWWGRREIDNGSLTAGGVFLIAGDLIGARQYFCSSLMFFAAAILLRKAAFILPKSREWIKITSPRICALLSMAFIIVALYKMILSVRLLITQTKDHDMREAFKDILSEPIFNNLPVVDREQQLPSDTPAFLSKEEPVIVIQYWKSSETEWKRETVAFCLDWNEGYGYGGPSYQPQVRECKIIDTLRKETAFLLKELFSKGKCGQDPLTLKSARICLKKG